MFVLVFLPHANSSVAISGNNTEPGNHPTELPSRLRKTRRWETDVSGSTSADLDLTTLGSNDIPSDSGHQLMKHSPLISHRGSPIRPARCSTSFSVTRTSNTTSLRIRTTPGLKTPINSNSCRDGFTSAGQSKSAPEFRAIISKRSIILQAMFLPKGTS